MILPPDTLLPSVVIVLCWALWIALLPIAFGMLWRAWNPSLRHLYPASTFVVFLLWQLGVFPPAGPGFHFLGLTAYTLMFGWGPGILGASAVVLGHTLEQGAELRMLAVNSLILAVLPVSLATLVYHLSHRYLPHHLFIYLFIAAFFSAIFSTVITVGLFSAALVGGGVHNFAWLSQQYLAYLPLFVFPEGVLNGMITTILVALRPQWLRSFDDHTYLR